MIYAKVCFSSLVIICFVVAGIFHSGWNYVDRFVSGCNASGLGKIYCEDSGRKRLCRSRRRVFLLEERQRKTSFFGKFCV